MNAAESGANVAVTGTVGGEFKAGDTVTLTVNGTDYQGTVNAAGTFSIAVAGSDLKADSNLHASVSTTDAAGNSGQASLDHGYTVDAGAPAVTVNAVALTNDNTPDITGTTDDPHATIEVTVGGHTYTATNNGDGTWTLPGSAITSPIPDGASNAIQVTATDAAGNSGNATGTAAIDTAAPVPTIAVDAITPDNVINAAESGGDVDVTGTVGGEFKAGDTVTLTVNGTDYQGTVNAAGTFSIAVAGSDLKADSNLHASVSTTDAAGNTGTASLDHAYTVDLAAQATDDTDRVTEDSHPGTSGNVLSNDEQGAVVSSTGDQQGNYGTLKLNSDGSYSYQLDGRAQALGASAHQQESFTYTVTDAAGNTAQARLVIDVTGTGDRAVITGTAVGAVTEDTALTTGGKLDVTDPDKGQAEFVPMPHAAGAYGTFMVQPDGTWSYQLDNTDPKVQALTSGGS
ncbi:MAG: Ig-like domain-containing protein, partial [Gammaproteobacteria bacterium]